jgi:hypothetical protein
MGDPIPYFYSSDKKGWRDDRSSVLSGNKARERVKWNREVRHCEGLDMTFPGEALLIRLWETLTEKGIGGLLSPWQIKREGLAQLEVRRSEVIALAAAERDAEDIRAGRAHLADVAPRSSLKRPKLLEMEQENSSTPPVAPLQPIELATRQSISDAVRREVNVAKAVVLAEEALREDPQSLPGTSIGEDWLFRWRDYAGEVSSDQLRILWGKALAGELKSPGTYSLRALDFLRNLSPNEAQRIALLSRFVLGNFIARSQKKLLAEEGVNITFLMEMEDLGVISGADSANLSVNLKSLESGRFVHALYSHGRAIVLSHEDPARIMSLDTYTLTEVGRQIQWLGTFAPHEGYLRKVGEEIKLRGFTVVLGSYRQLSADSVEIFDEETL